MGLEGAKYLMNALLINKVRSVFFVHFFFYLFPSSNLDTHDIDI
jgi:hypothetical protein